MGTVVGVGDCDPLRWPNSKWRNLQVEWDEHSCVERPDRVSLWEIETPESLFVFPALASNLKRHLNSGIIGVETGQGTMIKRHTLQSSENVNLNFTYPINPNLQSEQLIEPLIKAQCLNSDIQVECSKSVYANILQNIKSHELLSSATSLSCQLRSQMQHDEAADQIGVWQNYQFPLVQQLMLPLQGIMGLRHSSPPSSEQQQLANLVLSSSRCITQVSQTHPMGKQTTNKPLHEQQCQNQDECSKHKDDIVMTEHEDSAAQEKAHLKTDTKSLTVVDQLCTESHMVLPPAVQGLPTELPELSGKHFEENLTVSLNPNDTTTEIHLNKATIQTLGRDLQLIQQQQQVVSNIGLPNLEGISSIDVSNLHSSRFSSEYLENGWWSSNGASHQSSTIGLSSTEPPNYSVMQMSHMLCPDSSTISSADISNVLDPEVCVAAEGANFSIISETNEAGILQSLSHGLLTANQAIQQDLTILQSVSNPYGLKDFSDQNNNQNGSCGNLHSESGSGSRLVDPFSNTGTGGFGTVKFSGLLVPPEVLHTNCNSCQDVQSQVTSTSLADCQAISFQEFPDYSGGTSSSNVDIDDSYHLNKVSWKSVPPPLRTYTKVQKSGSVGRSIDVTRFRNYDELKSAIACIFGLDGQLDDPRGSTWKLVYVDYENDILLVGDDPWEEFVTCVKCIRILSPSEVQQMSKEGLQHVSTAILNQADGSSSPEIGQPSAS